MAPFVAPSAAAPRFAGLTQGFTFPAREARRDMHDDQLVERIAAGDHDAFAALYDRHSALVYGVARRMLANDGQAEDVTQTIFLQIWAHPGAYRGGSFAAWVGRVARNACLDILRSSAVRLREPEVPLDMASDDRPDEEAFANVRAESVSAAVRDLPVDQRTAIEMAYFTGLSYREVAEKLGAPLGTVKSRIRMGLRSMWESLRREVAT